MSMRAEAERLVERTTKAQGLPRTITDPGTIERIAVLVGPPRARTRRPQLPPP